MISCQKLLECQTGDPLAMAKFLLMTIPAEGHMTQVVPIVRKLIERGHQVVWIAGREYRMRVEAVGAQFEAIPEEVDPNGAGFYDRYPKLKELKGLAQIKYWVRNVFLNAAPREVLTVNAVVKDFAADVFVGDTVTLGLSFAAELNCKPCVCISVLPPSPPSRDTAPYGLGLLPGRGAASKIRNRVLNVLVHRILLRELAVYANAVREKCGVPAIRGEFLTAMRHKMSLVMFTTTPAFEYPRTDLPDFCHFIGPILPEATGNFQPLPWWSQLEGPDPVVLINQGTVANAPEDLILRAVRGLSKERMEIVAVPVKDGLSAKLPANVHAAPFIPFDRLLPHVDVMVTNGGYNGTQCALAHGVPLVVAGETEDKREVAARVEWCGAGVNLRRRRPSPELIREAVKEVLGNPFYRENARRIQADFASYNAPLRAAELLEGLVGRKRQ